MRRRAVATVLLAAALAAPAAAGADEVTVRMPGKYFEPARLTTVAGDRVTFRNNDLAVHDVRIAGGAFDSGAIARFTTWSQPVEQPGEYPFVCTLHAFMSGNLSVVAATLAAAPDGVLAGEPLTLSGRAPAGTSAVGLERSVAGGDWILLDPAVRAAPDGGYVVRTPAVEGASYRVTTPAGASPAVTPGVTARVDMPPYEPRLAPELMEVAPDFVDGECLTRFTDKALAWIKTRAAAAREGQPFFLYLPYTSPHLPVIPLEQFRGQSGAGAYGDFMLENDWHVGRLLDLLDAEQLTRDTLIVFSSDNGPENPWRKRIEEYQHFSSGPYRDGKRSIYEGGHRVPFIVRWPAQVKAGGVWTGPVCQTDLLATFADIVGAKLPAHAGEDSVSFHAVLTGQTTLARPPLIHHAANGRFAVREGKWKLVMEHAQQPRELYDLATDPGEKNNVIAQHAGIAAALAQQITAVVQNGRTTPGAKQPNDTGWWDDLAWIPHDGAASSSAAKSEGQERPGREVSSGAPAAPFIWPRQ